MGNTATIVPSAVVSRMPMLISACSLQSRQRSWRSGAGGAGCTTVAAAVDEAAGAAPDAAAQAAPWLGLQSAWAGPPDRSRPRARSSAAATAAVAHVRLAGGWSGDAYRGGGR